MSSQEDDLDDELQRIRQGADPTPTVPAMPMTPGQFWHKLLTADPERRMQRLEQLMNMSADGFGCFAADHRGVIEQLEKQLGRFMVGES